MSRAAPGDGDEVVILEVPAREIRDPDEQRWVDQPYAGKYVARRTGDRAAIFHQGDTRWMVDVSGVMAWAAWRRRHAHRVGGGVLDAR